VVRNAVDIDRWIANLSRFGALTSALNWYRAAGNAPSSPSAGPPPQVQCVPGSRQLERRRSLRDRVPQAVIRRADKGDFRYERVEGASHWMMVERPDEVNRLLLGFLKK
jgi:pimeloyl-ACP methyl ester carboxylesterase